MGARPAKEGSHFTTEVNVNPICTGNSETSGKSKDWSFKFSFDLDEVPGTIDAKTFVQASQMKTRIVYSIFEILYDRSQGIDSCALAIL